ncbi:MAG: response regulator [bacterium]|nr:response regulator [bacterium]
MMANGKSVLVVDDDEDIRNNIQDILTDQGYQTDAAQDGVSALEMVRRCPYDVALLDYKMPGMDGATLCREIKLLRPDLTTIMVTACAGHDGIRLAQEAGTWRVLYKPVDVAQLLPIVHEASHRTPPGSSERV